MIHIKCENFFWKDPDVLNDKISIIFVSEGTILCKEGDFVI